MSKLWEKIKTDDKGHIMLSSLEPAQNEAKITFTDRAMVRLLHLVTMCEEEVAWHGSIERLGTGSYLVKDIYLYSQDTTHTTVYVTDETYGEWCYQELINNRERAIERHFHGHSHVNMGVTPSSVDLDYQYDTIQMLPEDGFYLFMIINKYNDVWMRIVDCIDGVEYDTKVNTITIDTESGAISDICEQYKANVRTARQKKAEETKKKKEMVCQDFFDEKTVKCSVECWLSERLAEKESEAAK